MSLMPWSLFHNWVMFFLHEWRICWGSSSVSNPIFLLKFVCFYQHELIWFHIIWVSFMNHKNGSSYSTIVIRNKKELVYFYLFFKKKGPFGRKEQGRNYGSHSGKKLSHHILQKLLWIRKRRHGKAKICYKNSKMDYGMVKEPGN